MARTLNSNGNVKTESRFDQKDFVITVSTVCVLAAVLIGVIVIFLRRRFRSKNTGNTKDVEMQSMNDIEKETQRLILKTPSIIKGNREADNVPHKSVRLLQHDGIYINSSFSNKSGYIANGSIEDEDLDNEDVVNEDLFKYLYPQLSRLNVPHSPHSCESKIKSSVLITEIIDDVDVEAPSDTKNRGDETENTKSKCVEKSLGNRNPFNYDSTSKDNDNINLETQTRLCHFFQNQPQTKEEDEYSEQSLYPVPTHSSISNTEGTITKDIIQKCLIFKSSPTLLDQMELGFKDIEVKLAVLPNLIYSGIDEDVSNILEIAENIDTIRDKHEHIDDGVYGLDSEFDQIDVIEPVLQVNIENNPITELGVPRSFVKSAGDNIYQDDFLRDSSETSTLTSWPGRMVNASNAEVSQRGQYSSVSVNNQQNVLESYDVTGRTKLEFPFPNSEFGRKFDFSFTIPSVTNEFGIREMEGTECKEMESRKEKSLNFKDGRRDAREDGNIIESNKINVPIKKMPDSVDLADGTHSNSRVCDFQMSLRSHKKQK